MFYFKILFFVGILTITHQCNGAKILGLFPFHGHSHFVIMAPILEHLAEHGHEVDVISHFPRKNPLPGYHDISLEGTLPPITSNVTIKEVVEVSSIEALFRFFNYGVIQCDTLFKSKIVQDLYRNLDKTKYDLILTEVFGSDCFLAFAHKLKDVPVIGISTCVPMPWSYDRFGLPDNPAYHPVVFLNLTAPMSLFERVKNTVASFGLKLAYYYLQTLPTDKIVRKYLKDDSIPSMYEMEKRMTMLLTNTHYSLYGAHPNPPNVVEIAGIHITKFNPLPKDIEQLLNNSRNGVILFTLGSMVRIESLSPDKQRALLDTFSELPYNVILKANRSEMIGPLPKNVYFQTWIPQREILCHPNTKLFITHGGLMGTQEAIFCGVPMIGMPLFGDQLLNIAYYIKKGVAVELKYADISKENVLNAINRVLNDPSYTQKVKQLSELFRDRPMPILDTVAYWIEYVIRHNGAPHLRPASVDLAWYQLYLLDVFLVLTGIVILVLIIIYLMILFIFKQCRKKKKTQKLKRQ